MENDLYTITLCRADWETVLRALNVCAADRLAYANRIGLNTPYGAAIADDGYTFGAVADHLDFILPE